MASLNACSHEHSKASSNHTSAPGWSGLEPQCGSELRWEGLAVRRRDGEPVIHGISVWQTVPQRKVSQRIFLRQKRCFKTFTAWADPLSRGIRRSCKSSVYPRLRCFRVAAPKSPNSLDPA